MRKRGSRFERVRACAARSARPAWSSKKGQRSPGGSTWTSVSPRTSEAGAMASTFIGGTLTVEGELSADGPVTIAGTVQGRITARERVVVERSAKVIAEIE